MDEQMSNIDTIIAGFHESGMTIEDYVDSVIEEWRQDEEYSPVDEMGLRQDMIEVIEDLA